MQQPSTRGVSFSLAGWLWADLLLGLMAIFLAASAVASAAAPKQSGLDPKPMATRVPVDSRSLLSNDPARVSAEQQHITSEINAWLAATAPGRHAAIIFAYGASDRPADGDKLATLATDALKESTMPDSVMKAYHELVTADTPGSIAFEIYFDE